MRDFSKKKKGAPGSAEEVNALWIKRNTIKTADSGGDPENGGGPVMAAKKGETPKKTK